MEGNCFRYLYSVDLTNNIWKHIITSKLIYNDEIEEEKYFIIDDNELIALSLKESIIEDSILYPTIKRNNNYHFSEITYSNVEELKKQKERLKIKFKSIEEIL